MTVMRRDAAALPRAEAEREPTDRTFGFLGKYPEA